MCEPFIYEVLKYMVHLMQGRFSSEVFLPANLLTYLAKCLALI